MTIAIRNWKKPRPSPATKLSSQRLSALSCGSSSWMASERLTEARLQMRSSHGPMTGHVATLAGGGGTVNVPALR